MTNIQACMGPQTSLTVTQHKLSQNYGAVLWAEDSSNRNLAVQWAVGHGANVEAAIKDLDTRLTGLTYDDVMRS